METMFGATSSRRPPGALGSAPGIEGVELTEDLRGQIAEQGAHFDACDPGAHAGNGGA